MLCATAALRGLHCAFTDKLLSPRGIPASFSFLSQIKHLQTFLSLHSVDNHDDDEELKTPEESVEVIEGELPVEGGREGEREQPMEGRREGEAELPMESRGEGERGPQDPDSALGDKEVQAISDVESTGTPPERGAVENMEPSFLVKPLIHEALSYNFPSKVPAKKKCMEQS